MLCMICALSSVYSTDPTQKIRRRSCRINVSHPTDNIDQESIVFHLKYLDHGVGIDDLSDVRTFAEETTPAGNTIPV